VNVVWRQLDAPVQVAPELGLHQLDRDLCGRRGVAIARDLHAWVSVAVVQTLARAV
jgi:hypothetical protein